MQSPNNLANAKAKNSRDLFGYLIDSMHYLIENKHVNADLQAHCDQLSTEHQDQIRLLEVTYNADLDEYTKTMSELQQKNTRLVAIKNNYLAKLSVLHDENKAACQSNIQMTNKISKLSNNVN
jgi:hypothetical protein